MAGPFPLPRALRSGDVVAVVAPAGPAPTDRVEKGLAALESLGYRPRVLEVGGEARTYFAGSDASRAAALQAAFADPQARAVWCLRGGYGCIRTLERLDLGPIRRDPRLLVGFSDVTALHLGLGMVSVHGPVVTQLGDVDPAVRRQVAALLAGEADAIPLDEDRQVLQPGVAEGPLVGGNLSVMTSLAGTGYLTSLQGRILFIEDVAERPYRLDRMLTQLRLAGVLDGVRGLVIGRFSGVGAEVEERDLDGLWREVASWIDGPVVRGLAVGHTNENLAVPVGVRARLDSAEPWIRLLEPVVR